MEQLTRFVVMERIGMWLAAGVKKDSYRDKQITRWCNNYRVWTNSKGQFVEVGRHGQGKPIVVVEKRPPIPTHIQGLLFSPPLKAK